MGSLQPALPATSLPPPCQSFLQLQVFLALPASCLMALCLSWVWTGERGLWGRSQTGELQRRARGFLSRP